MKTCDQGNLFKNSAGDWQAGFTRIRTSQAQQPKPDPLAHSVGREPAPMSCPLTAAGGAGKPPDGMGSKEPTASVHTGLFYQGAREKDTHILP